MTAMHTVILDIKEDPATGEWGFVPQNTLYNEFNTAFTAQMIWHDVFEHWFEDKHKYFKGKNAFNVAGEIAAMGAMWYYYENVMGSRVGGSYYGPEESTIATTQGYIQEAIEDEYTMYGDTLESDIPRQKPIKSGDLEYIIDEHWKKVKACVPTSDLGKQYKASITKGKLANLYRWGYRMAEKMGIEYNTAYDFWEYFEGFCKVNTAEDLANDFDSMKVTYNKKTQVWKAYLITHEGKKIRLKPENAKYPIDLYDFAY